MKKWTNAEAFLGILIALVLFSVIFLTYSRWQSQQNQQSLLTFQKAQALQIAENQIALKMAGADCDNQIIQNAILFSIFCTEEKIRVRFPLGEIEIGKID